MKYLDKEATRDLVFELKDNLNSDSDVKEIVQFMTDQNGKYEPVVMNMGLVNYFLKNYKPEEKRKLLKSSIYKLTFKDFIPFEGSRGYVSRNALYGDVSSWRYFSRKTLLDFYGFFILPITLAVGVGFCIQERIEKTPLKKCDSL